MPTLNCERVDFFPTQGVHESVLCADRTDIESLRSSFVLCPRAQLLPPLSRRQSLAKIAQGVRARIVHASPDSAKVRQLKCEFERGSPSPRTTERACVKLSGRRQPSRILRLTPTFVTVPTSAPAVLAWPDRRGHRRREQTDGAFGPFWRGTSCREWEE